MQTKPDTFRALIDRFGGVAAFADKTKIGEFAAKKMRDRNSISAQHWPAIVEVAASDEVPITMDDLARMWAEEKAQKERARRETAA